MQEPTVYNPSQHAIAARLTAFAFAWQQGEANLADYLPSREDPLYADTLCELVRRDLRERWLHGRPILLASYRACYPDLFGRRSELAALAFEEYRQRALAGEQVTADEYREFFNIDVGDWPPPHAITPQSPGTAVSELARELGLPDELPPLGLEATLALRRLARAGCKLPKAGDRLLDFTLLRELGRGSFARVFLARQTYLADRPVVLKISPQLDDEPRTLAQLQHTNIVPIYSVHQSGPLQIVCMPYFGSITLAMLMNDLGYSGERLPVNGRDFLAVLFRRAAGATQSESQPIKLPPTGVPQSAVTLNMLGQLGYVDVVLWLSARIAAGLAHAHERSILHCDLKPENILLTDDGQPMLLDFNVSVDSKVPPELRAAQIGGTLPYMAPERLDPMRFSRPADGRADLYSLGVIMYRLLTGFPPYDSILGSPADLVERIISQRRAPPIPLRRLNPLVSPPVESIVCKLLEPDPEHRYLQAAHLHEDLERQLARRPLRHAASRSPLEQLRRWRGRHPRLAMAAALLAGGGLLFILTAMKLALG